MKKKMKNFDDDSILFIQLNIEQWGHDWLEIEFNKEKKNTRIREFLPKKMKKKFCTIQSFDFLIIQDIHCNQKIIVIHQPTWLRNYIHR